jgi:hypothetical protein
VLPADLLQVFCDALLKEGVEVPEDELLGLDALPEARLERARRREQRRLDVVLVQVFERPVHLLRAPRLVGVRPHRGHRAASSLARRGRTRHLDRAT